MNTPRFRDGGLDDGDWVANAFRAADADAPSGPSKDALLSSLGLSGVAVVAGTAAVTTGSAAGSALGGATASAGAKLGAASALVKWLVVGSVAVASIGVGAKLALSTHAAAPVVTSAVASTATSTPQAPSVLEQAPAIGLRSNELPSAPVVPATAYSAVTLTAPAARLTAESKREPAPESAAAITPSATGAAATSARITQEIAALDQARSLLHAGRGNEAQDALRAYTKDFPDGVLGPEARMLQVEALLAAGRTQEASAQAHALLNAAPNGPLSARLRDLAARADGNQ